jgi:DNA-binding PadR family transcriptional regulator
MSAKIAVLGLVIEEPSPAHRLTAKLRQRLSSAEFVDSNVYSALARLEREGLVRSCAESSYEATDEGVRHFEQWLFASSSAPPLRDELHMKIALCQPQNLPRMIELVYGQELVCLGRVQELKKSFERIRPPDPSRWSGLVMVMVRDAELAFWEARLSWLQGVRESLENMGVSHQDASRPPRNAQLDTGLRERVAKLDAGLQKRVTSADAGLQKRVTSADAGLQDSSRRQPRQRVA